MTDLYLSSQVLISPLGLTPEDNKVAIEKELTGIRIHQDLGFQKTSVPVSIISELKGNRYDTLLRTALEQLKKNIGQAVLEDKTTLFIVSSTKGNLVNLQEDAFATTRSIIGNICQSKNPVLIISNACISGVLAINQAADYLKTGKYNNAFIIGIDTVSDFVLYGFQSLYALSDKACAPFDASRNGTTLGEACGIVCLSTEKIENSVLYLGGASSNDANHISGPSRTGEGLFRAVNKAIVRSGITVEEIDFISAHGTATVFNDEMESIAFSRLGLQNKPVNSLKGYFGHTLGAAGVIETIVSLFCMEDNRLYKSLGFELKGTSEEINIVSKHTDKKVNVILKTASGFGGGNAALILKSLAS